MYLNILIYFLIYVKIFMRNLFLGMLVQYCMFEIIFVPINFSSSFGKFLDKGLEAGHQLARHAF